MTKKAVEPEVVGNVDKTLAGVGVPSYAFTPASIAYDKSPSQSMGALCTGMGYAPNTPATTTTASKYIGGAAQTIGYYDPTP